MQTKLRVKLDDSPLHSGHSIRGMGFYTRNLIDYLEKSKRISLTEEKYEIIHYPYFDLFSCTLSPNENKKIVVTVPDVIPLLYPDIYHPGIKGKVNLGRQIEALKKVDAVITISETSKKDIVRLLDIPSEKVFVTLLGPGNKLAKTERKAKLPNKYVLYVGDVNWNKNIINLVKAVNKAGLNLVIIGKHAKEVGKGGIQYSINGPRDYLRKMLGVVHPEIEHLNELRDMLREADNVMTLGYLDNEDFAAAYQQATVYCQPSYYEGFGLPLLEAMQAGLPIVASKTQALVEVADNAAVYFDPYDVDDMADKITKAMSDSAMRKELITLGKQRLKRFSWEKTANETVNVYEHII